MACSPSRRGFPAGRFPGLALAALGVTGLLLAGAGPVRAQEATPDSAAAADTVAAGGGTTVKPGIVVLEDRTREEGGNATLRRRGNDLELRISNEDGSESDRNIQISIGRTNNSSGIVRFGESVVIHADEVVDGDVVVIGGSITCAGVIEGDCVAIGGSIHLQPGAEIQGDAVCLGGRFTLDEDVLVDGDAVSVWGTMDDSPLATVDGELVEVGGFGPVINISDDGWSSGFRSVGTFFQRLVWAMILVGLGLVVFWVFPDRMGRVSETVSEDGVKSFFAGLAFYILWPAVFIALIITIIGILGAIALMFITPLIMLFGYLAVGDSFGNALLQRFTGSPASRPLALLIGILCLEAPVLLAQVFKMLGVFPLVHILLLLWVVVLGVASCMGVGAILVTRFRARAPESRVEDSGDYPTPSGGTPLPQVPPRPAPPVPPRQG